MDISDVELNILKKVWNDEGKRDALKKAFANSLVDTTITVKELNSAWIQLDGMLKSAENEEDKQGTDETV